MLAHVLKSLLMGQCCVTPPVDRAKFRDAYLYTRYCIIFFKRFTNILHLPRISVSYFF